MPPPWRAVKDQTPGSEDYYFWNQQTDETSWDLPAGYVHIEGQPYLQPITTPPPAYDATLVQSSRASSEVVQKEMPSLLTCPSCSQAFVVGENPRRPKLLGCGHTFCQEEVDKLGSSGTISCPVCHLSSSLPCNPNFALEELITSLAEFSDPDSGKCVECDKPATLFCSSCKAQLCAEHDRSIHSFKSSAGHQRGPLSAGSEMTMRMCKTHPEETLKIFCLTCQIPICRDCKDFAPAHAGHPTNLITNVVLTNKALLEQEAVKLRYISQLYLTELSSCLESEHQLDLLTTNVKQTLANDVSAMIEQIKTRQLALENQLNQFVTAQKALIRRHRQEVLFAYSNVAVTQEECVRVAALPGADLLGQLKGTLSHSIAAASQHPHGSPPLLVGPSISFTSQPDLVANWGRLNCVAVRVSEAKQEADAKQQTSPPATPSSSSAAPVSPNSVISSNGFPVPKRPTSTKTPALRQFTVSTPTPPQPIRTLASSPSSYHTPSSPSASSSPSFTPAPPLRPVKDPKLRALAATTDPNLMSLVPQLEYLRKGSQQFDK